MPFFTGIQERSTANVHDYQEMLWTGRNICTVKPVLSGHRIKRTPSIKQTVPEVPKFISLIYFK